MKNQKQKRNNLAAIMVVGLLSVVSTLAQAAEKRSLVNDLDSLSSNKKIAERAQGYDPENRIRVVQNRLVDRDLRFELGISYGSTVGGGNSYYDSSMIGYDLEFHLNPNWSFGLRFYDTSNTLTAEGKDQYDSAWARYQMGDRSVTIPDLDYAKSSSIFTISYYPIYGKINLLNVYVPQFDLYAVAGGGQINLRSGSTPVYTAGIGTGFWLAKHLSARIELRWQTYDEQVFTGTRRVDSRVASAGIGFLL